MTAQRQAGAPGGRPKKPKRAGRATKPGVPDRAAARHLVVGIGASAGGLEAFTELLRHLPTDTGMAFVLVQHLDPARESALSGLLSRVTSLPVREVTSNVRVRPDRIYVIPPNSNLGIANAVLELQPRRRTAGPHRSIDIFFESLARDQRERAIGVILSGTASDGTLGLEAIKAEGGITFAQDDSAKYDSMPRSAVGAGCVDFVLKPEDIAKELARIAKHPFVAGQAGDPFAPSEDDWPSGTAHEDGETPLPSRGQGTPPTRAGQAREGEAANGKAPENSYKKALLLLRNHSGVDFSLYKSTTIQRRIARRMVLNKHATPEGYARFLRGNAKELDALYSDALISVTSFFRNPETFEVLQRKVLPKLLQRRADEPLRAWVLGCSTGQEAYSIAMAFMETAQKASSIRKLQIFATDLNEALLDKARHGLYAKTLAHDISPERLRRFFVEEEGGYRIIKPLREMVVFARQNLIGDPPFSRMDLVSCRNLLIYLEPSLQKKAFPTFHYALKPGGFLLLGASESIGGFTDLFEPVDNRKHKIYTKKAAPTPAYHLPAKKERGECPPRPRPPQVGTSLSLGKGREEPESLRAELNSQREADRVTVNKYAPPGVLVNAALQILQFRGPTSAYLQPPTGKASFDVLKMAREGLMLPLRAAINKARKENKTARKEDVEVRQNGGTRTVNLEVIPLKNLRERCFLILFDRAEDGRRALPGAASPEQPKGADRAPRPARKREESRRVAELEREIAETCDYLQSLQEQHEAANEELQAANEEVQSANEELQSINEELETSKEELESTNEELTTVNEEMTNRNAELNRLNSDLVNLQTSTHLAILLLGRDLTIRRFSVQAEKQFNLLATDLGRPIGALRHNLDLTDLETFVGEVIATVREREREVRDRDGRWYSLRVWPYLSLDNKVDGAVLVLVDIDALKRTQEALKHRTDQFEILLKEAPLRIYVVDADFRIRQVNPTALPVFGNIPDLIGRDFDEVIHILWPKAYADEIVQRFRHTLETGEPYVVPERMEERLDRGVSESYEWQINRILLPEGRYGVVCYFRDISERLLAQQKIRESEERYRTLFAAAPMAVFVCDRNAVIQHYNQRAVELWGREPACGVEQHCGSVKLWLPNGTLLPHTQSPIVEVLRTGNPALNVEVFIERPDGSRVPVLVNFAPLRNAQDEVIGAITSFMDITERKEAEQRQRLLTNELAHRGKNLLAVIQSIASRSLSGTRTLAEARQVLTQRIQALARSQSVLVTGDIEGAPVAEIVRLEFEAFSDRVEAVGPDVMLNPRAAQTFALLVHELATNAAKYGALSRPGGRVSIEWRVEGAGEEARFKFRWQERGGPPVAPPTHQGFGRILIEMAVAQGFRAQPTISFAPEGLSYEIDAPLPAVSAGPAGRTATFEQDAGTTEGQDVLTMD